MTDKSVITDLVLAELSEAASRYAPFSSHHEGYAVLLEEVEEAAAEMSALRNQLNDLWINIKKDKKQGIIDHTNSLMDTAYKLIGESVQVAAMIRKISDLNVKLQKPDIADLPW